MSDGLAVSAFASARARSTAATSLPSGTAITCQPAAANRPSISSVKQRAVGPRQADPVVVVQDDELPQAEVAGQGAGLGGEPLHEIAVARKDIGEMVHDPVVRAG